MLRLAYGMDTSFLGKSSHQGVFYWAAKSHEGRTAYLAQVANCETLGELRGKGTTTGPFAARGEWVLTGLTDPNKPPCCGGDSKGLNAAAVPAGHCRPGRRCDLAWLPDPTARRRSLGRRAAERVGGLGPRAQQADTYLVIEVAVPARRARRFS